MGQRLDPQPPYYGGSSYTTNGGAAWNNLNDEDADPIRPIWAEFLNGNIGYCMGLYLNNGNPDQTHVFKMTDPLFRLLKKDSFIAANGFSAAPNPTSDVIRLSGTDIGSIQVFDVGGKLVWSENSKTPMR